MSGWNNADPWAANEGGPSNTWDAGAAEGVDWNAGAAAANDDASNDNRYEATGGDEAMVNGNGGGDDRTCRICSQVGHLARNCPQKPEGFGKCFNCGEEGHSKADCTNPRVFSGACRLCAQEGHAARDCPTKPPVVCRNCRQEGHITSECTNNKVFDFANVTTLPADDAWANVLSTAREAVETRDLDDFREAIKVYQKAVKEVSYEEIEHSFRVNGIGIYLIATEPKDGEVLDTHTLINLNGKRDCQYKVGYYFKKTPRAASMAEGWPTSDEENFERLKDAGAPYERGIPKCLRCKEMGHTSKDCKQERQEFGEIAMKCFNCDEEGHRTRDCKAARVDRFACRNCKQSGHNAAECPEPRSAEGVECKRCAEIGHFAKDCPNNPGGSRACRNCGEEGHIAKECEKPKNPATTTCRNCEQVGHFSKDCPEPRDWSKVKCNTCGEMGHTVKRCPQAKGDTEAAGIGGYDAGDGGDAIDGVDNINGDSWGGGAGVNTDAGGASGWMAAGDSSNNWGTAPEATKGGDW